MKRSMNNFLKLLFAVMLWLDGSASLAQNHGTKADREALFDYLYEKTLDRESVSPYKVKAFGVDLSRDLLKMKEEIINADSDEVLYFALVKFSNIRKNRHLSISPLQGGLNLEQDRGVAPIRFHPDFGKEEDYFMFVSDLGKDIRQYVGKNMPAIGDQLVAVNGMPFNQYFKSIEPYYRYSTRNNLLIRLGHGLSTKDERLLPSRFYGKNFALTLRNSKGREYTIELPYLEEVKWQSTGKEKYPGFKKVMERVCYHLYLPTVPENKTILLWWYGFRGSIREDMNDLITYAQVNNLLDHNIIVDLTDSRGGSRGAVMIRRLSPKSYKTTFGNLKMSDITDDFIAKMTHSFTKNNINDHGAKENDDDGHWVMDWLHTDVLKGLAAGQEYSNDVPFKCAHAPKYSDGVLHPAEVHFKGKMVCLFGPWGGSHLDQFSSIVNDNDLAYTIGMPTGGYSNTWEWTEDLKFPTSGRNVVTFMWDIGHTIRPNGQILEGNPAPVDEFIPVTAENFGGYKAHLLEKAMEWLSSEETKSSSFR